MSPCWFKVCGFNGRKLLRKKKTEAGEYVFEEFADINLCSISNPKLGVSAVHLLLLSPDVVRMKRRCCQGHRLMGPTVGGPSKLTVRTHTHRESEKDV